MKTTVYILILLFTITLSSTKVCGQLNIEKLKQELSTSNNYKDSVNILNELSEHYRVIYPDSAEEVAFKAYKISLKQQDTALIIESGNRLAMAQKDNGASKAALSTILRVYELHKEFQNKTLLASSHLIKGHIYNSLYDGERAIDFYQKSVDLFKELNDSSGLSFAYSGLGIVYYDRGEKYLALENYLTSEQYWLDGDFELKADLWNNLGAVYVEFENWPYAELYYSKALSYYEKSGWKSDMAMVYYNLGEMFSVANNYAKSEKYYQKSYNIGEEISSGIDVQWALYGLYDLHKRSGSSDLALEYHEKYTHIKDSLQLLKSKTEVERLENYYDEKQRLKDVETQNEIYSAQNEINVAKIEKSDIEKLYYKRLLITIVLSAILLMLLGAYIFYRMKSVNRVLKEKNTDIEEKKQVIDIALAEKEVLLKEVHHRVKNNLQIISSLLNLQSHQLTDSSAIEALDVSKNRIQAIALIHQKLYQSSNFASVNFKAYVQELMEHQKKMYADAHKKVETRIDCPDLKIGIDTAVPLGLIVAELVTNSFKHAFKETNNCLLNINLSVDASYNCKLSIFDNGSGLKEGFNLEKAESLGMEILKALTEQIFGEIKCYNSPGARFEIEFKLEEEK